MLDDLSSFDKVTSPSHFGKDNSEMRYLYCISLEESSLEMSVEKMVDIYLTETPDKLQNAEELQNHYQIDSSVIRFSNF